MPPRDKIVYGHEYEHHSKNAGIQAGGHVRAYHVVHETREKHKGHTGDDDPEPEEKNLFACFCHVSFLSSKYQL